MRKIFGTLLLVGLMGTASAWEYQVVVEGSVVYQDPLPPANIAYPPPGERAGNEGASNQGRQISAAELRRNLSRPHLVIIPDQQTAPRTAGYR